MPEILVEFDRSTQSIGALREAAYRIVREASCQIERCWRCDIFAV